MEDDSSSRNLKRPFPADDDTFSKPPMQKRIRFPKGKKLKQGEEGVSGGIAEIYPAVDPRFAAKDRANRRRQIPDDLLSHEGRGSASDVSYAEVAYEGNENLDDDGVPIEPFNLDKEREEGYFDAQGNFVEYVKDKEIKDAWLDSVDVAPLYAGKGTVTKTDDDVQDLSSNDVAKMKRRIADVLEPGETVLQALRRLKGTSNNRKEKMSAETKVVFDQLTEDAMKLMENGEYNVYHESQDVFEREAEGYESLLRARGEGSSISADQGYSDANRGIDIFSAETEDGVMTSESVKPSSDEYDMFAEDDGIATTKQSSDVSDGVGQPLSNIQNTNAEGGALESDYAFDESSGYYYSSSFGYYYDPSSGLYCSASSGKWFSFNEETSTYDEIQEDVLNAN
ncbi:uncharacterized protein LOC107421531 isoform X1 [Ziziphus jujuba]|uniref:Uncharacterized protein LOC107421531 isoform X1 n=1 Tax=Ziziphus jujuba TaxID=326968 RepID=A0A6P4AKC1_ZIZJJ|nr:uncharacterized protein LOC107421531 isoform X1 [Ziziphus jujuba]